MEPKLVRMAKEIPGRLKDVMNSMFEASEPALRTGVSTLRRSLSKLDSYLQQVEREHLGSATMPVTQPLDLQNWTPSDRAPSTKIFAPLVRLNAGLATNTCLAVSDRSPSPPDNEPPFGLRTTPNGTSSSSWERMPKRFSKMR